MIYGSICSGIEAASVAWEPMGWKPRFFSEINKNASLVLAHQFGSNMPGENLSQNGVPNYGDFTTIPADAGPIDLLVGGTPCQAFSMAGKRLGLDDPRGNLAIEFCRLAKRLGPKWIVWENVPGVLSSNRGADFAAFITLLVECGYSIAWRVLDAQYVRIDGSPFAVPQRRRRVFVVGYIGDWRPAGAVLFEPEGMRGDPAPPRKEGKGIAADFAPCLVSSGTGVERVGDTRGQDPIVATRIARAPIAFNCKSSRMGIRTDGVSPTLLSMNGTAGNENGGGQIAIMADAVRRLTPRECERLQGFPDDWTAVPSGARILSDGPRYHAIGNSMAVNVMRWIGQRIDFVDTKIQLEKAH